MAERVYRSSTPFVERESSTLVIACGSNVYLPYVRDFLAGHLKLAEGTYDFLSVPGGPQFLMLTEYLPKFAWAGQRWVKFLVSKHRLKRVVLITHQDCAWYEDERMLPLLLNRVVGSSVGSGSVSAPEHRIDDLAGMARSVESLLPGIAVEAYFAQRETDGAVGFVKVT